MYGILCILNWSFELVCGDKFGKQAKIRVKPPYHNLDTLQVTVAHQWAVYQLEG